MASAENLRADVEGEIENVDGVLRITRIRLLYHVRIPPGKRSEVERALEAYADKCPAYQSIKGCIDVSWDADLTETD